MSFWWLLLNIISVVLALVIINKAIQIKKLTIEITENKPKHFHIRTSSAFLEKMPRNIGAINVSRKAEIEITKKIECFFIVNLTISLPFNANYSTFLMEININSDL